MFGNKLLLLVYRAIYKNRLVWEFQKCGAISAQFEF